VGKYIDLPDAYLSVTEALRAGGFANDTKVKIRWVPSDECETREGAVQSLDGVDAICVPGGFGIRGLEGKLGALKYARETKLPVLGLCLGLQCMVIEYARNVVGLEGASSSEFEPDSKYPVIATMEEQLDIVDGKGDLGGTMRLGLYEAKLDEGSVSPRPTAPRRSANATGTATKSTTNTVSRLPRRACPSPEHRRTASSWSTSNFPAKSTRTTWPRRRTPS